MKKLILATAVALCIIVLVTSCMSTEIASKTMMNQISSEGLIVNTFMDRDDYTVVGTVRGESGFVYYDSGSMKFVGDSNNYGYINERVSASVDHDLYVGVGRENNLFYTPETALERAKLNALYNLIQEANELEADFIFEPTYTVEINPNRESGELMYKVTVKAVAAKINY